MLTLAGAALPLPTGLMHGFHPELGQRHVHSLLACALAVQPMVEPVPAPAQRLIAGAVSVAALRTRLPALSWSGPRAASNNQKHGKGQKEPPAGVGQPHPCGSERPPSTLTGCFYPGRCMAASPARICVLIRQSTKPIDATIMIHILLRCHRVNPQGRAKPLGLASEVLGR